MYPPQTLRVIGAGVGRTGTSSLAAALSKLLGGRCYHFEDVIARPEHVELWGHALRGELTNWDQLFSGYVATTDWPGAAFWEPLSKFYPDAYVLLSTRSSAAEWYASAAPTIGQLVGADGGWRETGGGWLPMAGELLRNRFVAAPFDESAAIEAYHRHNDLVRSLVPADRLIEWQPTDGWAPLCERLGVPEPVEAFPHLNTRGEFVSTMHAAGAPRSTRRALQQRARSRVLNLRRKTSIAG